MTHTPSVPNLNTNKKALMNLIQPAGDFGSSSPMCPKYHHKADLSFDRASIEAMADMFSETRSPTNSKSNKSKFNFTYILERSRRLKEKLNKDTENFIEDVKDLSIRSLAMTADSGINNGCPLKKIALYQPSYKEYF